MSDEEWIYADMLERIGGTVRAVQWSSGHLALAGGGADVSDDGLLDIFERLANLARTLAPEVVYAPISVEESFKYLSQPMPCWSAEPARGPHDTLVVDAFPYQVLGPGHVRQLGEQFGFAAED